jgi:uncharacterized protein (TIGR02147 family)
MEKILFSTSKDFLIFDYELRKKRNPRFSKRSYAKILGFSSGRLTEILKGRSPITMKKASNIVDRLIIGPHEKQNFLNLVQSENYKRTDKRRKIENVGRYLSIKEFELIKEWEYFSLMALIETDIFKSDIKWIAEKLGISQRRANFILERLIDLGFIFEDEKGIFHNQHNSLSTLTDIPSSILREANAECIRHALNALEIVDFSYRDVTSLTIPINPNNINEAKELIKEFKTKLKRKLQKGMKTEVYNLNIQLIPVTKLEI